MISILLVFLISLSLGIGDVDNTLESQAPLDSCSFDITVDDTMEKLMVVMEAYPLKEEELLYDSKLVISIYKYSDLDKPVQRLVNKAKGNLYFTNEVIDANFDDYNDFNYLAYRGAGSSLSSNFFIWDSEDGMFKFSEELSNLCLPTFYKDEKIVEEFIRNSAATNCTRYYKYIDDKLVMIRELNIGDSIRGYFDLTVKDMVNGKLEIVFRKKVLNENCNISYEGNDFDEFFKWMELDYHGEKQ